jgi:NAD+ synthase (glutamine-hydrolysing)
MGWYEYENYLIIDKVNINIYTCWEVYSTRHKMKVIKVGAATLNQIPMDWDHNVKNILEAVEEAKNKGVDILCLPELCLTGYGCEDSFFSDYVLEKSLNELLNIYKVYCNRMVFTVGLPVRINNKIYNCVAAIKHERILGIVPKQHLANNGVHYEKRWFSEWEKGRTTTIKVVGHEIPFGDIILNKDDIKFGFEICEDAWVPDRTGISLYQRGVDIILNPSASHFSFGKHETRKRFVIDGSRAFNCTYVYSNLVGNESGRVIYDGDTLIASNGELLADGERFTFENTQLVTANVKINTITNDKNNKLLTKPIKNKEYTSKFDEFENACCLGLRDYLKKSKSKGFILSLSGGADSSAVALLVYLMVEKINKNITDEKLKVSDLLTCVYQGTNNSSDDTFLSAFNLSEFIGANFFNWKIDSIIEKYTQLVEESIKRELTWEEDDITLQNIQARVRGPGIWMLANIKSCLLLTTSNRSEAAVGYSSMDGDTCGGLAPLGGIDKAFILDWLQYKLEDPKYKKGLISYSKLKPTAELRPLDSDQSDEDDLMPYYILEMIEKLAIRDKMSPIDIFQQLMCEGYNNSSPIMIKNWVVKFFKLWSINQWKRERYAPSFHFDDESLDPKTWCRWPILNSGMKYELLSLEQFFEDNYKDSII